VESDAPLGNPCHSTAGKDSSDRVRMVRQIFAAITGKYDFLNHLLSLRRDISWRRFTVDKMEFFNTRRLLDVATGTCDLAIEGAVRYPHIHVTGIDFVREMLERGFEKVQQRGLSSRIDLVHGDALHLPFPDGSFDVAAMAFGIRNIPHRMRALSELRRVVVPGGQILILELTLPQGPRFRIFYRIYLKGLIPLLARVLSPDPGAYQYLGESIMNFPTTWEFQGMMGDVGLVNVEAYALTYGISHMFAGHKPKGPATGPSSSTDVAF